MILDIQTANKALKTSEDAIKLYSNVLDRVVPWKAFQQTLTKLDRYKEYYSPQSTQLIGEIKTLMNDGIDAYHRASKFVFKWSDVVIPLLSTYVELFNEHTVDKAHTQKDLLVEVLTEGLIEMKAAQQAIAESSISFNQATGKLTTLNSRFQVEFNEESEFFQSTIDKLYLGYYVGTAIFSYFGMTFALSALKEEYIPQLKEMLKETEDYYNHLKSKVDQAFHDIDDTKNKLNVEIVEIGELKIKTKETNSFIDLDDIPELRDTLVQSAQNLIDNCNEYRRKHTEQGKQ